MKSRLEKKEEMMKQARWFDYPNGTTMRLSDWFALARWWPPFKVFDMRREEWLTVDNVVLRHDGTAIFKFAEERADSNGQDIEINNWQEIY